MALASIIGTGRMGSWFAAFLKLNGYEVKVCDRNHRAAKELARKNGFHFVQNLSQAADAELIILATPTRVTNRLIEQVSHMAQPNSLIVEISSVKGPLESTITRLQNKGSPILSIHPMFGPGVGTIAGRTVIIAAAPQRNHAARKFLSVLSSRGARLIRCTLKQHDKLASIILALPHFTNIVLVKTLRSLSIDPNQLLTLAGTTFKLQFLIAEAIFQEDFGNEVSILIDNKHSARTLKKLARETYSTLNAIQNGDTGVLRRTLKEGHSFMSREKLFSTSYKRFNAAVEASSHR